MAGGRVAVGVTGLLVRAGAARPHVLVVEDHTDTAVAMQKLLSLHGFSVRAVGSYRAALATASEWMPDLLIFALRQTTTQTD